MKRLTLFLFSSILLFLLSCQQERTVISHIPENALAVATIQTSSLAAKLLVDKVGDYDLEEAMMKLKRGLQTGKEAKEAIHRILENPAEFGLDLFTEAYIHISQSQEGKELYAAMYLNVSNPEKLNQYMVTTFSEVIDVSLSDEGGFVLGKFNRGEMMMGWNEYLFVLILPIGPVGTGHTESEIRYLFSLNNPQTLPDHHLHVSSNSSSDIAFSLSAEQLQHTFKNSEKFLYFTDDFRFLNAYFDFHKGYLEIEIEGEVQEKVAPVYRQILQGNGFNDQFPTFDEERLAAFINLQFNPAVVNRLIKEFKYRFGLKMALLPTSFDEDEFYDLFRGAAFLLMYQGETNPDWQMRIKTNGQMNQLLTEFHEFGFLEKDKNFYRYSTLGQSSVFWTERNWLLIGNKPDLGSISVPFPKGELHALSSQYPASAYIRFDRMNPTQKKWFMEKKSTAFREVVGSFKHFSFKVDEMKGTNFKANLQIHFTNHDISSFAELVRILSIIQRESPPEM